MNDKQQQEKEVLEKLEKTQVDTEGKIKLDVGGTIFATSLQTLKSVPDSYFSVMFSERWNLKKGEDGCCFIDRNPKVFAYILDFMRGEPLNLEFLTKEERIRLGNDAVFYRLEKLAVMLPVPMQVAVPNWKEGPNYTIEGNKITKNDPSESFNANALLSTAFSAGFCEASVKILNTKDSNILIGVAPTSLNQAQLSIYASCGWYFNAANSKLYGQGVLGKEYSHTGIIENGGIVNVRVDLQRGGISFSVNGTDCGVAYKKIPTDEPLCLCVIMYAVGDSVEFLPK